MSSDVRLTYINRGNFWLRYEWGLPSSDVRLTYINRDNRWLRYEWGLPSSDVRLIYIKRDNHWLRYEWGLMSSDVRLTCTLLGTTSGSKNDAGDNSWWPHPGTETELLLSGKAEGLCGGLYAFPFSVIAR